LVRRYSTCPPVFAHAFIHKANKYLWDKMEETKIKINTRRNFSAKKK
jgi:hypothetical protein